MGVKVNTDQHSGKELLSDALKAEIIELLQVEVECAVTLEGVGVKNWKVEERKRECEPKIIKLIGDDRRKRLELAFYNDGKVVATMVEPDECRPMFPYKYKFPDVVKIEIDGSASGWIYSKESGWKE